ncbi:UNVERIFIED_CONTAM: hypothetical protein HDU68_008387 [Siphonaria sp. JEL0065]|nr:hypothetical protein HDU68_008387 [Siphonaria sp. JEL0065]
MQKAILPLLLALSHGDSRTTAGAAVGPLRDLSSYLSSCLDDSLAVSDVVALFDALIPLTGLFVVMKDATVQKELRNLLDAFNRSVDANTLLFSIVHVLNARVSNLSEKSLSLSLFFSVIQTYAKSERVGGPVVNAEYNQALASICNHLIIPKAFANDLETLVDSDAWKDIHSFKANTPKLFAMLSFFTSDSLLCDEALVDSTVIQLISHCATFLGSTTSSSNWITSESQTAARSLLENIVRNCSSKKREIDSLQFVVEKYAKRILESFVKPYFQKSQVKDEKWKVLGKQVKKKTIAGDVFNDQPWKSEFLECVPIFEWVVGNVKSEMSQIQFLVVPTVLTLVDDFDPKYKSRGLQVLKNSVLPNLSPIEFRTSGLGQVFFETLRICLTYHSNPPVLRDAFSTITLLASTIETRDSEAFIQKLAIIMEEGVLRGLRLSIGGRLEIIRAILVAIPQVVDGMGVMTIKYLKPLAELTCEVLEIHHHDLETQLICGRAIESILCTCWPRVNVYRGIFLKAFATAWINLDRDDLVEQRDPRLKNDVDSKDRLLLRAMLKELIGILDEICGDDIQV